MNIPNLITIFRIICTPILIILLLDNSFSKALSVFILAGLSDGLDGFLARYLKQKTTLGSYLDPIADKLLLSSTFITLATLKMIPTWLAVVVVSRDVIIVLGVAVLFVSGSWLRMKPSMISKLTTVSQLITVIGVMGSTIWFAVGRLRYELIWLTALVTIFSGLHYIYMGVKAFSGNHSSSL